MRYNSGNRLLTLFFFFSLCKKLSYNFFLGSQFSNNFEGFRAIFLGVFKFFFLTQALLGPKLVRPFLLIFVESYLRIPKEKILKKEVAKVKLKIRHALFILMLSLQNYRKLRVAGP